MCLCLVHYSLLPLCIVLNHAVWTLCDIMRVNHQPSQLSDQSPPSQVLIPPCFCPPSVTVYLRKFFGGDNLSVNAVTCPELVAAEQPQFSSFFNLSAAGNRLGGLPQLSRRSDSRKPTIVRQSEQRGPSLGRQLASLEDETLAFLRQPGDDAWVQRQVDGLLGAGQEGRWDRVGVGWGVPSTLHGLECRTRTCA